MPERRRGVILRIAAIAGVAAAAGCGTCVSVEATYEDAWQATREALRVQPDLQLARPVERYDKGTIEVTVVRRSVGDELHYRAEITPAGGEDSEKRKVCVWVQEVDGPVADPGSGTIGKMQAYRRRDLEKAVTRLIDLAFGAADETEAE